MKTYKIHLIRHGLAEGAMEGKYIGHTDVPLTEKGMKQLRDARDDSGYPDVDIVVSGPLKRCLQSAEILYPDQKPVILDDLIECDFGEFENQTAKELRSDPAFGEWLKGGQTAAPPYGESNEDFSIRVRNCFDMLVDGLLKTNTDSCAVITHGGVIMTILAQFGLPERRMIEWTTACGCGYTVSITPSIWSQLHKCEVLCEIPEILYYMDDEEEEEEDCCDLPFDADEFIGFYDPKEAGINEYD